MKLKNTSKLDIKDLKLLAELEKNSRSSLTSISKKIGVSKEVANYRLKRLLKEGIIKGFKVLVDHFVSGCDVFLLKFNLSDLSRDIEHDIELELKNWRQASYTFFIQSSWDLEIHFAARAKSEFMKFYESFIEQFSDHLQKREFSIVTDDYYLGHSYLHGTDNLVVMNHASKVVIDDKERMLLDILEENPRQDLVAIAEKLSVPVATISGRLKSLHEKAIIKAIVPVLKPSLLGYDSYRVSISLNDPSKRSTILEFLLMKKNVTRILKVLGSFDLEFFADFKEGRELDTLLREMRTNYPYIMDFEVMLLREKL